MKEAFRVLSAGAEVTGLGKNFKTLLITSAGPKEGKSVVAANLAAALAESGRKVMIIDANLRNPVQHKIWKINNAAEGLTSVFKGSVHDYSQVIQETRIKNLLVVPSGYLPSDSGEIIISQEISLFIDEMKKQAEIILLDTSPLLLTADTALLAAKTDGVLMVVAAGMYKRELIKKAVDLLGNLNVPILGTVLNMAESLHTFSLENRNGY